MTVYDIKKEIQDTLGPELAKAANDPEFLNILTKNLKNEKTIIKLAIASLINGALY